MHEAILAGQERQKLAFCSLVLPQNWPDIAPFCGCAYVSEEHIEQIHSALKYLQHSNAYFTPKISLYAEIKKKM